MTYDDTAVTLVLQVQSKKKKEKEKMLSVIQKLREEEDRQQQHVNLVLARLKHEKDTWFVSSKCHQVSSSILSSWVHTVNHQSHTAKGSGGNVIFFIDLNHPYHHHT